jgi:hypothetical protein
MKYLFVLATFLLLIAGTTVPYAQPPAPSIPDGGGPPEKEEGSPARSCPLARFDRAEVKPGGREDTHVLIVFGTKPSSNVEISLNPFVYVQQPDWWEIEVVACRRGVGTPVQVPYVATLDLRGSVGKKGVRVLGANNRSEDIPIPNR